MRYTVQKAKETADVTVWEDIATVDAEPRTKRSTVIKRALAEANIQPGPDKLKLRVLDEESAHIFEPEAHQPPAEWRLK